MNTDTVTTQRSVDVDSIVRNIVARFGHGPTIVVMGGGTVLATLRGDTWHGTSLADVLLKVARQLDIPHTVTQWTWTADTVHTPTVFG